MQSFHFRPPQSWCCLLTLAVKDVFVTTECRKKVGNFGIVRDFYEFICSGMHSPLQDTPAKPFRKLKPFTIKAQTFQHFGAPIGKTVLYQLYHTKEH